MNEIEIWKDIKGVEGYMVSNLGRVKSLNFRKTGKEKIMKQSFNGNGKGLMVVNICGKVYAVHKLVGAAFIENGECGGKIRHKNGNTCDNRAINLQVGKTAEITDEERFEVNTYDAADGDILTSNSFMSFAEALTFYEETPDKLKELHRISDKGFLEEVCASTYER